MLLLSAAAKSDAAQVDWRKDWERTIAATEEQSPLALWDLHDLRALDNSGFIDKLYT